MDDVLRMFLLTSVPRWTAEDGWWRLVGTSLLLVALTAAGGFFRRFKLSFSQWPDTLKSLLWQKHVLVLQGRRCTSTSFGVARISSTFSPRFKAVWADVVQKINALSTIVEVQEFTCDLQNYDSDDGDNDREKEEHLFVVSQTRKFLYDAHQHIYARVELALSSPSKNDQDADKGGGGGGGGYGEDRAKYDVITVTLFSYVTPVPGLIVFVNKLKDQYVAALQKHRQDQQFIYTLTKLKYKQDDSPYECWSEFPFQSTRTFANMFFPDKAAVLAKIEFFLANKAWYYAMGIPYALGIGLYGPPGTGKTSFIKCLAHLTGRHLVILSLKLVKTRAQLHEFFYEDRYTELNRAGQMGFGQKILVIEDIDCLGDLVCRRGEPGSGPTVAEASADKLENVLQTLVSSQQRLADLQELDRGGRRRPPIAAAPGVLEDRITLDDILNLWDGIKETPGRIMMISSNHYDRLDPALVRPGRIDMRLEMKNASHAVMAQIFAHYYPEEAPETFIPAQIQGDFYSPAELVNIYLQHKDDAGQFLARLRENKHV